MSHYHVTNIRPDSRAVLATDYTAEGTGLKLCHVESLDDAARAKIYAACRTSNCPCFCGAHISQVDVSPELTVARLRELVLERRRSQEWNKEYARQTWDELGEIEHENDEREFSDLFYGNVDAAHALGGEAPLISDSIWEYFRYEKTTSYLILLHSIIPALVRACDAEIATRRWGAS